MDLVTIKQENKIPCKWEYPSAHRLNNVERLGDYTGNLSQIPPFPLHKLAEVEGNGGWAPGGKGPEGQRLHQGHRRGHRGGSRSQRLAEPCPLPCLFPPFGLFPLSSEVQQQQLQNGPSWIITSQNSELPRCIPGTTPPSILTPAPCSAECSAESGVGQETEVCPTPPGPAADPLSQAWAISLNGAGKHAWDIKDSISVHKTNNAAPGQFPGVHSAEHSGEKEMRRNNVRAATAFHQNSRFSLKSISSLATEQWLFLPVAPLKMCQHNGLKEIKTNSLKNWGGMKRDVKTAFYSKAQFIPFNISDFTRQ